MPLVHPESSHDLISCDQLQLNRRLQNIDDEDDEDFVEHDLDDDENSSDSDDEEDDDEDDDEDEDEESLDDSECDVDEDDEDGGSSDDEEEDEEEGGGGDKAKKRKKSVKGKLKGKKKGRKGKKEGQLSNTSKSSTVTNSSGLNSYDKTGALNNGGGGVNDRTAARPQITEANFVTITQKDELTSTIQQGIDWIFSIHHHSLSLAEAKHLRALSPALGNHFV